MPLMNTAPASRFAHEPLLLLCVVASRPHWKGRRWSGWRCAGHPRGRRAVERGDGPEGFLLDDPHLVGEPGEHRGGVEKAGALGNRSRRSAPGHPGAASSTSSASSSRPDAVASGPTWVAGSSGSPTESSDISFDEFGGERVIDVGVHDEALAGDAGLAVVADPRTNGGRGSGGDVRRGHDDERIRRRPVPARLLHMVSGDGGHRAPRRLGTRQGHRLDPRIGQDGAHLGAADQQRAEGTAGKPARSKSVSRKSAAWGTFEACLSRPELPAMSAGAAKRMTCQSG